MNINDVCEIERTMYMKIKKDGMTLNWINKVTCLAVDDRNPVWLLQLLQTHLGRLPLILSLLACVPKQS